MVKHDRGCALYVQHASCGSQTDAPAFSRTYQNTHKRARHTEGYARPLFASLSGHSPCIQPRGSSLFENFCLPSSALCTKVGKMASMPTAGQVRKGALLETGHCVKKRLGRLLQQDAGSCRRCSMWQLGSLNLNSL